MNNCICGNRPMYHCTSCTPNAILCISCIGIHLNENLDDSIKPIKGKNLSLNMCELCNTEKAVKLGVFEDYVQRLCRFCKVSADLYIDLKWANFVSKSGDLEQLTQRKSALKRLFQELDESKGQSLISSSLETIKNEIQQLLTQKFLEKSRELLQHTSENDQLITRLKKEASDQVQKREITTNTLGGKLLSSYLLKSPIEIPAIYPKLIIPEIKSLESALTSFISSIKLAENEVQEKNIFLFTPGKSILVKIKLSELKKFEYLFDKNWNFEASWCLLDNGDIFLCGGNGRDSSEVLRISINPLCIKSLQGFNGRSGHSVVHLAGEVYVFGGNRGNFAEKYLFCEDKWASLTPLPQKIQRSSSCIVNEGVLTTGSESDKLWLYQIDENTYTQVDFPLSGCSLRNKIIFFNENILYCLTGDRLIVFDWEKQEIIKEQSITDRDWWSYSSPIIHKNSAFFIKYFVRNLWKLSLDSLKLIEIPLNTMN